MKDNRIIRKVGLAFFCVISAFLYLLFFSQTLSPLYTIEQCDSSVFKLMGQLLLHGKTPYVDMFDHKGPMLYCIQAFGQWLIPGRTGLFLIAIMALSISIACWYKSARLFTTPIKCIAVVFLTLFTYYFYAEYGNFTEDWNIPFISVSFFLILSLVFDKTEKYLIHGCIIGLCLAGSFFIRPNDAVAFIGAPILGALVWMLKEKKYQAIAKWIGGMIIGFSTLALVFIVWFADKNALPDLWYGLIGFNAKYATGIKGLIKGCFKIDKLGYVPFLVTLMLLSWQHKERRVLFILVPTFLAGYVLQGNNGYLHYWIVWIPILFFSYWLMAIIMENKAFAVLAICVFLSLPIFSSRNWLKTPIRIFNEVKRDLYYTDSISLYTKDLLNEMEPEDKDSIWSYNLTWCNKEECAFSNAFNVLLYNEIIPCNRVPLIFMAEKDNSLLEYMDITRETPKYILFSLQHIVPVSYTFRDSTYIDDNYYVSKTCDELGIILYKRKD